MRHVLRVVQWPFASSFCMVVLTLLPAAQLLELDKREILAVPATELDDWQKKRHRAAAMVQAHWRGLVQRRKWAQREPERLRRDEVRGSSPPWALGISPRKGMAGATKGTGRGFAVPGA